jgi:hypothetical protein
VLPAVANATQFHHVAGGACLMNYSTDQAVTRNAHLINWESGSKDVVCPFDITGTSSAPLTVDPASWRVYSAAR